MKKEDIIDQFFIRYLNANFAEIAKDLSKGIGYGDEYAGCTFPNEDNEFDGVQFWYLDWEVEVSNEDFSRIMQHYLTIFRKKHPAKEREAKEIFDMFDCPYNFTTRQQK